MPSDLDRRLADKLRPRVRNERYTSGWPEHEAAALAPWEALGLRVIREHNDGSKFPDWLIADLRERLPDEFIRSYTQDWSK